MSFLSKTTLALATAATVVAATPANAGRYDDRRGNGISAGEVIAGALIIGGIAAIAASASNNRDRNYGYNDRYDYGRAGYDYSDQRFDSRYAVDRCVRAAQREASRYGRARITDVTRIDRVRGGFEVRGRLVVEQRGYRGGRDWDRYGNSYDRYNDGYNKGRFSCITRYDGIADLRLSGLNDYYG
jgi:hypothetical protein